MVVIELHDKQTIWVSEGVGNQVDAAWASHKPVKLPDGTSLATSAIKGIWPQEVWYDMHPEDRVREEVPLMDQPLLEKPLAGSIPEESKGSHYEAWRLNMELHAKGLPPKWKGDSTTGEVTEAEPGYFNSQPKKPVGYTWVKMKVSDKKYNSFYSASPGYKLLEKLDSGVIVAFKWPELNGVPPNHIETCSEVEITKLEKSK